MPVSWAPEPLSPQWLAGNHERLQPLASQADAVAVVAGFTPQDEAQSGARDQVLQFAAEHGDALWRTCLDGHFTASAWVVNHRADAGLVLLHTKIGRWLQPGGHADGDACLPSVALRECQEETGIDGLEVWSEPIDIDVHQIPATGVAGSASADQSSSARFEPEHFHLDVRFLVRAPSGAVASGNHESEQLRWISESELNNPELSLDEGVVRLAHYGFELARSQR